MTGVEKLEKCRNSNQNCFANKDGRCTALADTKFKNGICPFYKTPEQFAIDDKKAGYK